MRESLEAIRQHLEEIRDCHHRLILPESGSDRLQVEVVNPLARKFHQVVRKVPTRTGPCCTPSTITRHS